MSAESYRGTGRGGAGNFYSQQDINELTKRTIEDVEAQNLSPDQEAYPARRPSEYAHSGRGGAGNWYTPGEVDLNKPSDLQSATVPTRRVTSSASYGRGGAGNFSREPAGKQKEEEERALREKQEKVSEQTKRDVDMGLKMPERAHLGGREE